MNAPQKRQPIPFGKYLLLDRVNIGGMAEVWRAKTFGAGGFERVVAIKRILPNIAEDEEFISMFIDEAKITVQLAHANIAQIYELSHISNSYFIAMEYVSGKDMRAVFDRCRKRGEPAPIPLVCHVISRCCEGLDYAHRKKDGRGSDLSIVHRDVSPQNALVSYDGEVKIIDFGIAKAAGKATKTQHGILKGKFGYMSPEQIRGVPLDRRSDIFAMGICMYELLTGERLFVGESDFSVLEKVRRAEVLPPSHFNRKIPEALERIVMKALAKEVEDRHQYASELSEDLNRFIYTAGQGFGRAELAAFMKATFAEDYEKEKQRLHDAVDVKPSEGMVSAIELGVNTSPSSAPRPPPPPVRPAGAGSSLDGAAARARPDTALVPPAVQGSVTQLQPAPEAPKGAVERPSVAAALPRLTAAAPMLSSGQAESNATVLVDQSAAPSTGTNSVLAGATTVGPMQSVTRLLPVDLPQSDEIQTAPQLSAPRAPAVSSPGDPPAPGSQFAAIPQGSGLARLAEDPAPWRAVRATPPRLVPTLLPLALPKTDPGEVSGKWTAPFVEANAGTRLLLLALIGLSSLALGVGLFAVFRPKGLLMVTLPAGLAGKVSLQINKQIITEEDGSPLKSWPQIREVPAGKITIMLKSEGYKPFVKTVEVVAGNVATPLHGDLRRDGAGTQEDEPP